MDQSEWDKIAAANGLPKLVDIGSFAWPRMHPPEPEVCPTCGRDMEDY